MRGCEGPGDNWAALRNDVCVSHPSTKHADCAILSNLTQMVQHEAGNIDTRIRIYSKCYEHTAH